MRRMQILHHSSGLSQCAATCHMSRVLGFAKVRKCNVEHSKLICVYFEQTRTFSAPEQYWRPKENILPEASSNREI